MDKPQVEAQVRREISEKNTPQSQTASWWQRVHLLLWVSLGLHGILLGLSVPSLDIDSELASEPSFPTAQPTELVSLAKLPQAQPVLDPPKAPAAAPQEKFTSAERIITPSALPGQPVSQQIIQSPETIVEPPPFSSELPPETLPVQPSDPPEPVPNASIYTYDGTGTSKQESLTGYSAWLMRISAQYGVIPGKPGPPMEVTIDLNSCLSPPPEEVSVGLVVDANGQILEDPEILKRSGYPEIDRQVQAQVKTMSYPAEGTLKALTFSVNIPYDTNLCDSSV